MLLCFSMSPVFLFHLSGLLISLPVPSCLNPVWNERLKPWTVVSVEGLSQLEIALHSPSSPSDTVSCVGIYYEVNRRLFHQL